MDTDTTTRPGSNAGSESPRPVPGKDQASLVAGHGLAQVARHAADLRQDLDELIGKVPSLSAEALSAAKDEFLSRAETAQRQVRHLRDGVRDQINQCVDATTEHVREQPLRSLMAGIGVGVLVGLVMASRGNGR